MQGSPVVAAVRQRLAGIQKEYNELDGVWFMAGSLFNRSAHVAHVAHVAGCCTCTRSECWSDGKASKVSST